MTTIAASISAPEAILLLMAAGVTVGFLAVGARAMRDGAQAVRSMMQQVVQPYGGRIVTAGLFEPDRATFELDGVPCRMTWQQESDEQPAQTTILMDLRSRDALRVRPEGAWLPLRKIFGATDIEIGDGPFDSAFQVEGHPSFARATLSPAVRAELMRWREAGAALETGAGGTFFRVHRNFGHDAMQTSLLLQSAQRLLRALGGGAPVMKVAEFQSGACPTCRAGLEGQVVRCAKCGAIQHADCWQYVGGCAIYACGSTRST